MEHDELAGWLRLALTPGVGDESARRLLAAFGLPSALFAQPQTALRQVVGPAQAQALSAPPPDFDARLAAAWGWLQEGAQTEEGTQRAIVTLGDPAYPASLLALADPPPMLYLMGRLDAWPRGPQENTPKNTQNRHLARTQYGFLATKSIAIKAMNGIAIVGSRNPTPQGEQNARAFARALAEAGLVVVSGLAMGIDGAAHWGALQGAAGASGATATIATIAVVGTGLDRVYPARHRDLARQIAARGVLVSEYPLGTPALASNFPRRNRLIAGLSLGTLVVEAALQSGSLITARLTVEQGKEVFAIPGSIHSPQSHGCHALLKQGAKLVESAADVLEELRLPGASNVFDAPDLIANNQESERTTVEFDAETGALLERLGHDPVSLDALMARTGLDAARLQARLLELELEGHVARLPGGLFQRIASV